MSDKDSKETHEPAEGYDFSEAIRNPYPEIARKRGHRVLDADIRAVFPDSDAVNQALREYIKLRPRVSEFAKAS